MRHSDSKVWGLRLSSINLMPAAKDHMPCLLYKKVFSMQTNYGGTIRLGFREHAAYGRTTESETQDSIQAPYS